MPRRPYVHLAGNLSGWPLGFAPQPGHMRKLDQFSSELVDGEDGGSWAPAGPIVLGPSGDDNPSVTLSTGSALTGDVETVAGNEQGNETDTPGLILQSGAVPAFESPRTRKVTVGFTNALEAHVFSAALNAMSFYGVDPETLGMFNKGVIASGDLTLTVPLPFRAQHRGATIDQVDFRVRVAGVYPGGMPATPMKFRVMKVTNDTAAFLHTTAGQYDSDGWYSDPAATVAAFTNNGQVRTLSFVPDQNNTNLDPSTSWYVIQARPAPAQAYSTLFLSATVNLSAIADYRQE